MAWTNTSGTSADFRAVRRFSHLSRVLLACVRPCGYAAYTCLHVLRPDRQTPRSARKNSAFGHGFLRSQGALSLSALVVAQIIEFVSAIQVEDPWLRTAVLPLRRSYEGALRGKGFVPGPIRRSPSVMRDLAATPGFPWGLPAR